MARQKQQGKPTEAYPYISYKTFQTFMDDLVREGVPPVIDRSMMKGFSGFNQGLILATLRFLNLIDANGKVQAEFDKIKVGWKEDRQKAFAPILKTAYPQLLEADDFSLDNAIPSQLTDKFSSIKNPDVQRKARTFFLRAATDAGFKISPRIQPTMRGAKRRASNKGAGTRPVGKKDKVQRDTTNSHQLKEEPTTRETSLTFYQRELQRMREDFPKFNDQWTAEEKAEWYKRWFELIDRIKESERTEDMK